MCDDIALEHFSGCALSLSLSLSGIIKSDIFCIVLKSNMIIYECLLAERTGNVLCGLYDESQTDKFNIPTLHTHAQTHAGVACFCPQSGGKMSMCPRLCANPVSH